jgi:hypothetical protein
MSNIRNQTLSLIYKLCHFNKNVSTYLPTKNNIKKNEIELYMWFIVHLFNFLDVYLPFLLY